MDTLATRVRAARKFRQLNQEQLAEASGANQSDISKIERGKIERTTHIIGLAHALQCDPRWLDTGDGPPPWSPEGLPADANRYSQTAPPQNLKEAGVQYNERKYPLLSSVQAGSWGVVDLDPSEIDEYVICPVDLGEQGFCLRVDGHSMTTVEGAFSFPEGMNVCFRATPDAGHKDFVCVTRDGEAHALFKQLLQIDGKWFLHSLNPQWPTKFIALQPGDSITGKLKYAGWQF